MRRATTKAVYLDVFNDMVPNPDTLYALNTADDMPLWSYQVIRDDPLASGFTFG